MALGGHLAFENNTSRDLPEGVTGAVADSVAVGVCTRFYLGSAAGWRVFDPWVSVGVEPSAGVFVTNHTPLGDARNELAAVAIPLAVGADFDVAPRLAHGIAAQVSPWIPRQGCRTPPGGATRCTQSNLDVNADGAAGLNLRYTFGQQDRLAANPHRAHARVVAALPRDRASWPPRCSLDPTGVARALHPSARPPPGAPAEIARRSRLACRMDERPARREEFVTTPGTRGDTAPLQGH